MLLMATRNPGSTQLTMQLRLVLVVEIPMIYEGFFDTSQMFSNAGFLGGAMWPGRRGFDVFSYYTPVN